MNEKHSLNTGNLRRRLLALYHQDGILDLVVGFCLVLLALVMGFEQTAFIGLIGIPAIFYIPLKNQIAIPRMGLIRFESPRKSRNLLTIISLLGIAVLTLFILGYTVLADSAGAIREMLWQNEILVFAVLLAGFLFLIGLLLKNQRFLIYAVASLVMVALTQIFDLRLWISVASLALIMILIGSTLLIRFKRQYPVADGE